MSLSFFRYSSSGSVAYYYFFPLYDYISFNSPRLHPSPIPNLPVPLNLTATVCDFIAIRAFTLITTKMVFRTIPPVLVIDIGRSFFSDSIDNLHMHLYQDHICFLSRYYLFSSEYITLFLASTFIFNEHG